MALMTLREGLPNNMLYADGASTMRNFFVIVAWHGGSPPVVLIPGAVLSLQRIPLSGRLSVLASPFKCQSEDDVDRAFIVDQDPVGLPS